MAKYNRGVYMSKSHPSFNVEECKIQASVLLKSVRSSDAQKVLAAAKRFQKLPEFKNLSDGEIIKIDIKRKQALTVIAIEKGFKSWSELKCQLPFIRGGFLNQWFKKYEDAKNYLQSNGGFLLPFQNQFFVCDNDYINNLGFDSKDIDWKLIDFDWVKPTNQAAWQRLYKKWMSIQGGNRHE
jgi:hypothetical protein